MAAAMVTAEIGERVAWVRLDRAERMNAMPRSFYAEIAQLAARLDADADVRVVIIHGAGRCFSVGGDIDDFGAIPAGVAAKRAYMREALAGFRAIDEISKPVIAAVHGHALGGGCELTMVCDIVVADETATFGTPEAGVGLVPGPGMVRGLAHVNTHWMKYLVMTGLPLTAEQARLAGLVNFVTAAGEHLTKAEEIARTIAARSPLAVAVGKALIDRDGWSRQQHVIEALALLQSAADFREGRQAFIDKRRPDFT